MQVLSDYPTGSFLVMMLLFSWLGHTIVTKYLMQKQIRSFLPKTIFTFTFSCSVGLLAMYLFEISLLQIPELFWDLILSLLVIICAIIIPITMLFRMPFMHIRFTIFGKKLPLIAITIVVLYMRVLTYWESEIRRQKDLEDDIQIFSKSHVNILVQIVVNYGVYIMALMSAYGAIWCPYIYYNRVETHRPELGLAKKKTKEEIYFIIQQIKKNKYELLLIDRRTASLTETLRKLKSQAPTSIFSKLKNLAFNHNKEQEELVKLNQKKQSILMELDTLHRVHQQSFSIYKQIVDEERRHQVSQTFMGKMFRFFSFILTAYSISRFLLTAWNILKGRKLSTDPITRLLYFCSYVLGSQFNSSTKTYSQYISFGFMGYLMISSVRSFSMNIKNIFDFILRRRRLNILDTDSLVLLLSEMYGIYFLSAVILLQSSLPRTYVTNFQQITGKIDLVIHFALFDKLFFWFCLISMAFIYFCEYQRKQKMHYIIKERNLSCK